MYLLQYASRKNLTFEQEQKVGKISKYDAPQKAREILNLSNRVFSKSVKWLLFTDSLKNDGFQ